MQVFGLPSYMIRNGRAASYLIAAKILQIEPPKRATLAREGIEVSISTVGRILSRLIASGTVVAVPILRRRRHARLIRGLKLFVLPPKRPDRNGCVEHAQSTWRYEFYATYELPSRIDQLQAPVDAFAPRFNNHRPAEYSQALGSGGPAASIP
jgi:hypothetical protein